MRPLKATLILLTGLSGLCGLAATLSSCTSVTRSEGYRELDGPSKALLIAYYPLLSWEQRDEALAAERSVRDLLTRWGIKDEAIEKNLGLHTRFSMEISFNHPMPISQGRTFPVQAVLQYFDGRRVDVSHEVQWQVQPELGSIVRTEGHSELVVSCISSDLVVSAKFLDEREASKVIRFQKPVQSLEIRVAESSSGFEESEFLKLNVIAKCKDQTQSDVSCQAEWKAAEGIGEISGCGHYHILSKDALSDGRARASVRYGGVSQSQEIRFAERHFKSR